MSPVVIPVIPVVSAMPAAPALAWSLELGAADVIALGLATVVLIALLVARLLSWPAHLVAWWEHRRHGPPGRDWSDRFVEGTTVYRWGRARTGLDPRGKVNIRGELWNAVSERPVPAGAMVEVVAVEGLTLRVRPAATAPTDVRKSDHPGRHGPQRPEPEPLAPDSEDTVTADTRPGSKPTC